MSAAADPAGTWFTAGCRAFALVVSPCLVHYSVGWNPFSCQSYAEWVLLDLKTKWVVLYQRAPRWLSTWRLLDSFSPFGQWYVGEMPYQNGRIIEIALSTPACLRRNFAGFHFWLFILPLIQHWTILPFLRSYPTLSVSLFPFDYASMLMLCEANPFMRNKWNSRLGKCTLTDRGVCKCEVMIGKHDGSTHWFPKASIIFPDIYYL